MGETQTREGSQQATTAAAADTMKRVSLISIIALVVISVTTMAEGMGGRRVGGVGAVQEADEATQTLLNGVRGDVAQRLNRPELSEFQLISYSSQVVAGKNYFAKMRIGTNELGDAEYVHIRVYSRPWENSLVLHGVQMDKTLEDPIEYFDLN